MNEILKEALKQLAEREGCPVDEDFFISNNNCAHCSEDQDISECWNAYCEWKTK